MLPAPDFRELELVGWALLSLPILSGAIATLLAASSGAQAALHLSRSRHVLAMMIGGAIGWTVLAGLLGVCLFVANSPLGRIVVVLLASVLGALTAYRIAKFASTKLNCYKCQSCGVRFRSQYPSHQCKQCTELSDRFETQSALANFSALYQEVRSEEPKKDKLLWSLSMNLAPSR